MTIELIIEEKAPSQKKTVSISPVVDTVKIFVYVMCYNEEFMIPFFLQHYHFADKIFVYDNESTDRSRELLMQDPRCTIITFKTQFNDKIHQYIKNNCWKQHRGQCDYVIVCDMDEFLYTGIDIKQYLNTLKKANKTYDIFRMRGFNMVSLDDNLNPNIPLIEQVKCGVPSHNYSKNIIFNPNRVRDINYTVGAHSIRIQGRYNWGPMLNLLHFKFIGGIDRVRRRYDEIKKRLSEVNLKRGYSVHYSHDPTPVYEKMVEDAKELLP